MLKAELAIPVIGNGDIWSARDALLMAETTGCDAVMIGRGALGNPFLFRQAAALLEEGRETAPPTVVERINAAREHLELAVACKGSEVAVREMRKHMGWYIKGLPGAARLREMFNQAASQEQMQDILAFIMGKASNHVEP